MNFCIVEHFLRCEYVFIEHISQGEDQVIWFSFFFFWFFLFLFPEPLCPPALCCIGSYKSTDALQLHQSKNIGQRAVRAGMETTAQACLVWNYQEGNLTHWLLGYLKWNLSWVIFKPILVINCLGVFREIALRWMSQDLTDDKSTLVQVMAWCREAASHYLSQCWPISMSPYGFTRPQWLNSLYAGKCGNNFKSENSEHMLGIKFMSTSCEIACKWMSHNTIDEKSTLMAWTDSKPLLEPMLTLIDAIIWHYLSTMSETLRVYQLIPMQISLKLENIHARGDFLSANRLVPISVKSSANTLVINLFHTSMA